MLIGIPESPRLILLLLSLNNRLLDQEIIEKKSKKKSNPGGCQHKNIEVKVCQYYANAIRDCESNRRRRIEFGFQIRSPINVDSGFNNFNRVDDRNFDQNLIIFDLFDLFSIKRLI